MHRHLYVPILSYALSFIWHNKKEKYNITEKAMKNKERIRFRLDGILTLDLVGWNAYRANFLRSDQRLLSNERDYRKSIASLTNISGYEFRLDS